jgi:hypothetical protein
MPSFEFTCPSQQRQKQLQLWICFKPRDAQRLSWWVARQVSANCHEHLKSFLYTNKKSVLAQSRRFYCSVLHGWLLLGGLQVRVPQMQGLSVITNLSKDSRASRESWNLPPIGLQSNLRKNLSYRSEARMQPYAAEDDTSDFFRKAEEEEGMHRGVIHIYQDASDSMDDVTPNITQTTHAAGNGITRTEDSRATRGRPTTQGDLFITETYTLGHALILSFDSFPSWLWHGSGHFSQLLAS